MSNRRWKLEDIQSVVEGKNPFTQFGYHPPEKERKVGEQWTDARGITWERRKGYKARINKNADSIRNLVKRICSDCKKDIDMLGDRLDKKIYPKTNKCFDCLQKEESVLRLEGKYNDYETLKLTQNKLSALNEFKKYLLDSIDYLEKDDCVIKMVMSNGDIERWVGAQNEELLKEAKEDLKKTNEEIKSVNTYINQRNKDNDDKTQTSYK